LYNWYAVADPRGLCPAGWHVPSDQEWTQLTESLEGSEVAGAKMKSVKGWTGGGNGFNSSGFSGLPGGCRDGNVGAFQRIGFDGYWWSSTQGSTNSALFIIQYFSSEVNIGSYFKAFGFSVRCVRD